MRSAPVWPPPSAARYGDRVASTADERPPVAWRLIGPFAAGTTVLLLAVANRYGFHRDELYFIQCGRHLSWGYVDQPPLTPLLARIQTAIAGDATPLTIRWVPALLAGVTVVLTALIARAMGGGRVPQALAAGVTAIAPLTLITGHLLSTTTVDITLQVAICLLIVMIIRDGRAADRRWLLVGLLAGLDLENKDLITMLAVALAAGLLIAGPRRVFADRWLWLGAVLALLLWLPNLLWQIDHHWPQLTMAHRISAVDGVSNRVNAVPLQLLMFTPLLAAILVAGLVRLLRPNRWRALGVAFVVMLLLVLITGGKGYYTGALLYLLTAAGAIAAEGWLARGHGVARLALLGTAGVLALANTLPLSLPVLSPSTLHQTPIVQINYDAGETIGWPAFVRTVHRVVDGMPADQRAHAVVFTGNYGEAGALQHAGGFPPVYSGHNNYMLWGRPPDSRTAVVVVGYSRNYVDRYFTGCTLAAHIDNGQQVSNDEQGTAVWRCDGLTAPWSKLWPRLKHYY
jgi:Dolichyl-phosphate-mannose-protein mannosyltransferase